MTVVRVLFRGVRLRCPCCGYGCLFRSGFTLYDTCTACDERFEREPGLGLGAIYVNLVLSLALAGLGVVVTTCFTEFSFAPHVARWTFLVAGIPVVLFRPAKGLWISLIFLGEGLYLEWPSH